MAYIDNYRSLLEKQGRTQRDRHINYLRYDIGQYAPSNPAFKEVVVNGKKMNVVVNSQNDYTIKEVVTMPGDRIPFGSVVTFANAPWLVTSTDIDDEVYSRSMMYLCNCKLKWRDKDGVVYTYDGVAEDATKYSEGVDETQYLRIAEFQIKVKVHVDELSSLITRDMRFIIDAEKYISNIVAENDRPFVFRVTRRNIITGTYMDEGYVEITLVQDQWVEGKDDYNLMIAAQPHELKEPYPDKDPETTERGWL